ncbi:uncharacterized protein FIBRA_01928 [Fibroporia radiculosa]|uniref:Uncharacterized protein n=1 Tax=Fibroporia radiculosa TaxID=599839 RepID=J4G193_9APHY|nr:uncharacterized protein FIBRA_01928 [Fibroporia radiculosa]CCL99903.1 predicted protein [Fibroporia radiculosa]
MPNVFAENILTNDLLTDIIFSCCSPAHIYRIAKTCRAGLYAAKEYTRHAFNINRHLSRYFDDISAFRSLQARTRSLISGLNALQFFDRTCYPESDLDLYVHLRWRREVGIWMMQSGYHFQPSSNYDTRGIAAVFTFIRASPGQNRKVQLIVARRTPMKIVLAFHSTCVMNVIAYDKAFALYPRATFEERKALIRSRAGRRQQSAIGKYATRGWEMVSELPAMQRSASNPTFRLGQRWIADGDSWRN